MNPGDTGVSCYWLFTGLLLVRWQSIPSLFFLHVHIFLIHLPLLTDRHPQFLHYSLFYLSSIVRKDLRLPVIGFAGPFRSTQER